MYSLYLSLKHLIHPSRQLRPTIILGRPGNPFPTLSSHMIFTRSWDGTARNVYALIHSILFSHHKDSWVSLTLYWAIFDSEFISGHTKSDSRFCLDVYLNVPILVEVASQVVEAVRQLVPNHAPDGTVV
jgi:hypothetical protein